MGKSGVTRRGLLAGTATGTALPAVLASPGARADDTSPSPGVSVSATSDQIAIVLQVNGARLPLTVEARTSLLDALREQSPLTGTKKGCDRGAVAPAPCISTAAVSSPA